MALNCFLRICRMGRGPGDSVVVFDFGLVMPCENGYFFGEGEGVGRIGSEEGSLDRYRARHMEIIALFYLTFPRYGRRIALLYLHIIKFIPFPGLRFYIYTTNHRF